MTLSLAVSSAIMLSVAFFIIMLSIIMLSVAVPNVIMLNVVAPHEDDLNPANASFEFVDAAVQGAALLVLGLVLLLLEDGRVVRVQSCPAYNLKKRVLKNREGRDGENQTRLFHPVY
jgi:hypothetical protein